MKKEPDTIFDLVNNHQQIKNEKRIDWKLAFLNVGKHYCTTTVLHGCKYLSEPKRTVWERIAWFFILWAFVGIAFYLLWLTAESSIAKPVIINLDTSYHPIWNYQFPALSFCPLNKLNRTLAENWIENLTIPSYINKSQLLEIMPTILRLIDYTLDSNKLELLHSVFELNNVSAHYVYSKISIQCKDYLVSCKLRNRAIPCTSLFRTIRTSDGYCCAFNYFGLNSEHNMNVYHVETSDSPTEPVIMRSSGRESGLSVIVRTPEKDNLATFMSSMGTKLLIHKPLNYPDHLVIQRLIESGNTAYYSVTPHMVNAAPLLRTIPLDQRDCYFFDEIELFSLRSYSYKNCIFNCRNSMFIKLCGCIPFIYPAKANQRVCNLLDVPCLSRNKRRFRTLRMNETIDIKREKEEAAPCGCRPQCNDIFYDVSSSRGKLIEDTALLQQEPYDGITNASEYSEITVYFKSLFATRYERIVYFNSYKLLASFGSLLGMFFGFSFVATFEFIYVFTVRVLFHVHLERKKENKKEVTAAAMPTTVLGLYSRLFPYVEKSERLEDF